jgi:hypothetical protein
VTLNLLGEFEEHVDLSLRSSTLDESGHHVAHPGRTLSARRALAARLVLVELCESGDGVDHVGRLVHDDDGSRAETGSKVLERVVVHADKGEIQERIKQNRSADWVKKNMRV